MHLFSRKRTAKPLPLPDGCTPEQIRIESSICTGEKTIGFYDVTEKKLRYAELVRAESDIAAFYARYGLSPNLDK
ncbi:MAG: hypothetical protein Q4D37_02625 [Oscillospiraceae bacterium]|nr:hypothetical protein [Oscillospiraceae bacterium]